MSSLANKAIICQVLEDFASHDDKVTVLCSDSRGSTSMIPFAQHFPQRFVEVGIAEQNLVTIAAGMANSGMKPFVVSPASFLSARSYEQIKVDVAYSDANVKLIGVSGGVSYGALGLTHHSCQDIAALCALPNMRVYVPSDATLTRRLMCSLAENNKPAYIRVARGASPTVYANEALADLVLDRAVTVRPGTDVTVIACGDLVKAAADAADSLSNQGVHCRVLDMYCLKPLDRQAVLAAAAQTGGIVTVEEHSVLGGLGSMVAQTVAQSCPTKVKTLAIPDEFPYSGNQTQVFAQYGLTADGILSAVAEILGL